MTEDQYYIYNANSNSNIVLTAEHAGNELPEYIDTSSLPEDWQAQDYSYDPGVKDFIIKLANYFDYTAILGRYSRILVDLNRVPGGSDIVPYHKSKIKYPMNTEPHLLQDERINKYYVPYHLKVREVLGLKSDKKLISIHSYAKNLSDPTKTPWHVGIQYPTKTHLVSSALENFGKLNNKIIGDNQPYNLREGLPGTISLHAAPFGRDSVELEFRDDQLTTPEHKKFWFKTMVCWLESVNNQ